MDTPGEAPKCMLFDPKQASFICVPPLFVEKKRYREAMTFVAMALSSDQWQLLQTLGMDDSSSRRLFANAEKATMLKANELEVQWGLRSNVGGPDKAKVGMNSLWV